MGLKDLFSGKERRDATLNQLADAEERYKGYFGAIGLTYVEAGEGGVLVRTEAGLPRYVSRYFAECLVRCSDFATLEQQACSIAGKLGLGTTDQADLSATLREAVDLGLLSRLDASYKIPNSFDGQKRSIGSISMVSANRPGCAKRCFESFMDNARHHGRSPRWTLFDDSEAPQMRNQYRNMVAELNRTSSTVTYCGLEEKIAFAEALAMRGLPRPIINFALFGIADKNLSHYGANLNAALIGMSGELGAIVDDDVICELGSFPGEAEAINFIEKDPTEFRYFTSREETRRATELVDEDYLALHERLLGLSLEECLPSEQEYLPASLAGGGKRAMEALLRRSGSIRATQFGIAGDSGMGSSLYYLFTSGSSRERLALDNELFQSMLESRAVIRLPPEFSVCSNPPFMTYAVGLDVRQALPPFFPILRNSDYLFSLITTLLDRDVFWGYIPRTVAHDPPEERRSSRAERMRKAVGMGTTDYIAALCAYRSIALTPGIAWEARCRDLGLLLRRVGEQTPTKTEQLLADTYLREKAQLFKAIQECLDDHYPLPEAGMEELSQMAEALKTALSKRSSIIPADLYGVDEDERMKIFNELLRNFGALLEIWPDLVSEAMILHDKGFGLTKPVDF